MTEEVVDGYYGGDELSLVDFSQVEPDEILSEKFKKGGQKWLLVSFKSTQNNQPLGRLVLTFENLYRNMYIYKCNYLRSFCLWLPVSSERVQIPQQHE